MLASLANRGGGLNLFLPPPLREGGSAYEAHMVGAFGRGTYDGDDSGQRPTGVCGSRDPRRGQGPRKFAGDGLLEYR